jgi:hypothetical protein
VTETYLEPTTMLDEYANGQSQTYLDAAWASRQLSALAASAERQEPDTVKVTLHRLQLHAERGWELVKADDLPTFERVNITRRPGLRPGKNEKATLEGLNPAAFLRSFFEGGIAWTAAADDLVYQALLAYAQAHLGVNDMRAARMMAEYVASALIIRAGGQPTSLFGTF